MRLKMGRRKRKEESVFLSEFPPFRMLASFSNFLSSSLILKMGMIEVFFCC